MFSLAQAVFNLFAQFGIKVSEIDYVSQLLIGTVNERLKQCNAYLWGVQNENEQTLIDMASVLTRRELENEAKAKQSGDKN